MTGRSVCGRTPFPCPVSCESIRGPSIDRTDGCGLRAWHKATGISRATDSMWCGARDTWNSRSKEQSGNEQIRTSRCTRKSRGVGGRGPRSAERRTGLHRRSGRDASRDASRSDPPGTAHDTTGLVVPTHPRRRGPDLGMGFPCEGAAASCKDEAALLTPLRGSPPGSNRFIPWSCVGQRVRWHPGQRGCRGADRRAEVGKGRERDGKA